MIKENLTHKKTTIKLDITFKMQKINYHLFINLHSSPHFLDRYVERTFFLHLLEQITIVTFCVVSI